MIDYGGIKMKLYKIRNRKTGLFSQGGFSPMWNKTGKFWSQLRYVKAHLGLLSPETDTLDWEIVEYELTENNTMNVDYFNAKERVKVKNKMYNDK